MAEAMPGLRRGCAEQLMVQFCDGRKARSQNKSSAVAKYKRVPVVSLMVSLQQVTHEHVTLPEAMLMMSLITGGHGGAPRSRPC